MAKMVGNYERKALNMSDGAPKVGDAPHPNPKPVYSDKPLLGTSPAAPGVVGQSNTGFGILGQSIGPGGMLSVPGTDGVRGEGEPGVHGVGGHEGVLGEGANGVHGKSSFSNGNGIYGEHTSSGTGVLASSVGGNAVMGLAAGAPWGLGNLNGVLGRTTSNNDSGVWGDNTGAGAGTAGTSAKGNGVVGLAGGAPSGGSQQNGVVGRTTSATDSGVWGDNTGAGYGVGGTSAQGIGVYGRGGSLAAKFEGDVQVTGNLNMLGGNVLISSTGDCILNDCAEHFDAVDAKAEPGTVMVIDQEGNLRQSSGPYDKRVAGVVSGAGNFRPGIILGNQPSDDNGLLISLLGKVYCKVDAGCSPIEVGDLLTTSTTPGHAMKAGDPVKAFGAIIGKALRPLNHGLGLIPILISLQ